MQIDIVNVATQLVQNMKQEASVAIIGVLTDLVKNLRKCIQNSVEATSVGVGSDKCSSDLQSALENCISHLSNKVCKTIKLLGFFYESESIILRLRVMFLDVHADLWYQERGTLVV